MTEVLGAALPENWSASRFKNVVTYLSRGTAPEYVDEGPVRAISQAANQDGYLDWTRTRFHSFNGVASKLKGYLKVKDILINSTGTGTLGRVGFFGGAPDGIPCMADSHVTIMRTDNGVANSRFTYYWLRSQPFQDYMYSALIVGATNQIELNREGLSSAPLPLPPIEEQRRIADFLDAETARIDALMRTGSRQAELIKEKTIEALRHHTTINEGTARGTGIPWMPLINKDWHLLKVGYHFLTGSGTTPTSSNVNYFDGKYPWVNSGDLKDGIVEARSRVSEGAIRDFPALKLHPPGVLVVAMYGQGETKGRVGILREASCVNQACCTLLPLDSMSTDFIFYWFRAHREGIVAQAYGAGQPNLSQQLIRQLKIPAPSIEKQTEITAYLSSLERGIEHKMRRLETRISLLAERRQALITAAVTGQFDVSTASGRGVTE